MPGRKLFIVASGKKPFAVMVGEYTTLAFLLPAATFVGYLIGYLLDQALGTHWLYIPFLILGIVEPMRTQGLVQQIPHQVPQEGGCGQHKSQRGVFAHQYRERFFAARHL